MLSAYGQTLGKRMMSVRIVRLSDQSNGGFFTNVLLRGVPVWLISSIPLIGPFCFLGDALLIFREDQRCLHDIIAGTLVIKE